MAAAVAATGKTAVESNSMEKLKTDLKSFYSWSEVDGDLRIDFSKLKPPPKRRPSSKARPSPKRRPSSKSRLAPETKDYLDFITQRLQTPICPEMANSSQTPTLSGLAREKSDPGRSLSSDVVLPRLSSSPPGRHASSDAVTGNAREISSSVEGSPLDRRPKVASAEAAEEG